MSPGCRGSLLLPVTMNEPGAIPDPASVAVMIATWTNWWLGGHSVQFGEGIPEMVGGVVSCLGVTPTNCAKISCSPFETFLLSCQATRKSPVAVLLTVCGGWSPKIT